MAIQRIKAFFEYEAAGGIVLALAAVAAMIIANTPLNVWYEAFIHAPVAIQVGSFEIAKDAHHWINDGLMAIFFFWLDLSSSVKSSLASYPMLSRLFCLLGRLWVG